MLLRVVQSGSIEGIVVLIIIGVLIVAFQKED